MRIRHQHLISFYAEHSKRLTWLLFYGAVKLNEICTNIFGVSIKVGLAVVSGVGEAKVGLVMDSKV